MCKALAWNFEPSDEANISVAEIVHQVKKIWPKIDYEIHQTPNQPHEASLLRLDCSKAHTKLKWVPVWDGLETIEKTIAWYKAFYELNEIMSPKHLQSYTKKAKSKNIAWAE